MITVLDFLNFDSNIFKKPLLHLIFLVNDNTQERPDSSSAKSLKVCEKTQDARLKILTIRRLQLVVAFSEYCTFNEMIDIKIEEL